jgi:hypothetical protein
MAECVILFRRGSGPVQIVSDPDPPQHPFLFLHRADAIAFAKADPILQGAGVAYQIVELDEL